MFGPVEKRLVLAVLAQELPELLDRLPLIRSEILGHHQLRAVPVGPDITAGAIQAHRVYIVAYAILQDQSEAEEIVQDSFLKAHQQRGMHDLYVVPHVIPRHPGWHQADSGRLAVVGRNVIEHGRPLRWQSPHHGSQGGITVARAGSSAES